jgi:hypothetical protein
MMAKLNMSSPSQWRDVDWVAEQARHKT